MNDQKLINHLQLRIKEIIEFVDPCSQWHQGFLAAVDEVLAIIQSEIKENN